MATMRPEGATGATMTLAPTLAALREPPRPAIERLASMAFRQVQLSATLPGLRPDDLDQSARRDVLAFLRRRGVAAAGLDCLIPADHFVDQAKCDQAARRLLSAVTLAADLGRCSLSVALPDEPPTGLVDSLVAAAERWGVTVADLRVTPTPTPGVGIGIDPPAWLAQGEDPVQAVLAAARHLVSVRLVDLLRSGERGPIGDRQDGQLDVAAFQVALSVSGYTGPIVLDARRWQDPIAGLVSSRKAWDSVRPA